MSELISIAYGMNAEVLCSPLEGVCYRQLYSTTWNLRQMKEEIKTYNSLIRSGFNAMDLYELDEQNKRVKMTDLSHGGRNLVTTVPDRYHIFHERGQEGLTDWFGVSANRPFYNVDDFLEQLRTQIDLAHQKQTQLMVNSLCFVLTPEGFAQTYIVDYGDGVKVKGYSHPEQRGYISDYLLYIANFYPQLQGKFEKFITTI